MPSFQTDYLRIYGLRRVCETLFIAALIYGCQQHLLIDGFFGPISPVTGAALSALFLRGRTMLLGIFLGNLISYITSQVDLPSALLFSSLFTGTVFLTREVCLRWIGPVAPLSKANVLFQFFLVASLFSGIHILLVNAFLIRPIPLYISWLGEVNGILYLTPLCLLLEPFANERYFNRQAWHWWVFSLALIASQLLIFLVPESAMNIHLGLSCVIFALVCLYGYYFEPIPLGITLLGLSVLYLGTSLMQSAYDSNLIITVLALQALLGFSISIARAQTRKRG